MCLTSFYTHTHTPLKKQACLISLLAYNPFNVISSCPSDLPGTLTASPARQHLVPALALAGWAISILNLRRKP